MNIFLRILLWAFIGYGLFTVVLFFLQDRMVYYPMKQMAGTPADAGLHYREIELVTPDGVHLSAWYVGKDNTRDVLLFCHGNAGNISHRLESLSIFHKLGLNILLFDYRGYGKSGGKPSEKGTYLDAETAWRFLVETEKIPAERIILFGRSLGGAVAAYLASRVNAGALILESTFTSIPDVGAEAYPFLPVRLLSRYRYNTLALLSRINIPVLVVHSPDDEIISFHHGKTLFEAANEPKHFLKIFGGHNDGFSESGSLYTDGLKKFLTQL